MTGTPETEAHQSTAHSPATPLPAIAPSPRPACLGPVPNGSCPGRIYPLTHYRAQSPCEQAARRHPNDAYLQRLRVVSEPWKRHRRFAAYRDKKLKEERERKLAKDPSAVVTPPPGLPPGYLDSPCSDDFSDFQESDSEDSGSEPLTNPAQQERPRPAVGTVAWELRLQETVKHLFTARDAVKQAEKYYVRAKAERAKLQEKGRQPNRNSRTSQATNPAREVRYTHRDSGHAPASRASPSKMRYWSTRLRNARHRRLEAEREAEAFDRELYWGVNLRYIGDPAFVWSVDAYIANYHPERVEKGIFGQPAGTERPDRFRRLTNQETDSLGMELAATDEEAANVLRYASFDMVSEQQLADARLAAERRKAKRWENKMRRAEQRVANRKVADRQRLIDQQMDEQQRRGEQSADEQLGGEEPASEEPDGAKSQEEEMPGLCLDRSIKTWLRAEGLPDSVATAYARTNLADREKSQCAEVMETLKRYLQRFPPEAHVLGPASPRKEAITGGLVLAAPDDVCHQIAEKLNAREGEYDDDEWNAHRELYQTKWWVLGSDNARKTPSGHKLCRRVRNRAAPLPVAYIRPLYYILTSLYGTSKMILLAPVALHLMFECLALERGLPTIDYTPVRATGPDAETTPRGVKARGAPKPLGSGSSKRTTPSGTPTRHSKNKTPRLSLNTTQTSANALPQAPSRLAQPQSAPRQPTPMMDRFHALRLGLIQVTKPQPQPHDKFPSKSGQHFTWGEAAAWVDADDELTMEGMMRETGLDPMQYDMSVIEALMQRPPPDDEATSGGLAAPARIQQGADIKYDDFVARMEGDLAGVVSRSEAALNQAVANALSGIASHVSQLQARLAREADEYRRGIGR